MRAWAVSRATSAPALAEEHELLRVRRLERRATVQRRPRIGDRVVQAHSERRPAERDDARDKARLDDRAVVCEPEVDRVVTGRGYGAPGISNQRQLLHTGGDVLDGRQQLARAPRARDGSRSAAMAPAAYQELPHPMSAVRAPGWKGVAVAESASARRHASGWSAISPATSEPLPKGGSMRPPP